jgi:hypothetical protein
MASGGTRGGISTIAGGRAGTGGTGSGSGAGTGGGVGGGAIATGGAGTWIGGSIGVGTCGGGTTSPVGGMGGGVGAGVVGSADTGAPGSPSNTNSTVAGGGSPSLCRSWRAFTTRSSVRCSHSEMSNTVPSRRPWRRDLVHGRLASTMEVIA